MIAGLVLVAPMVASATAARELSAGRERRVWRPPASIDRSGRTDVSAELERWFGRVPNGSLVQFAADTRYRLDGTVTLRDRERLEIDGNGATLRAGGEGDRERSQLRLEGGSDLHVHDLTVIGANAEAGTSEAGYRADREAQHAIDLLSTSRVEIDEVTLRDTYGDGVYIGKSVDGSLSDQVWVHDATISRIGRQGISVTAGRRIVIERNRISETRRSTVDLEPNTPQGGAEDVAIIDNQVGPGRLRFVAAHGNGPVNNIVVARNRLTGRPLTIDVVPKPGARRRNFWVVDNVSDTPARRSPIVFEQVDGLVVRGNRQTVRRDRALQGEVGVETVDVCGLIVVANDFGPGTEPLRRTGPACGPTPDLALPALPDVPGRSLPTRSTTLVPSTTRPAFNPDPRARNRLAGERGPPWRWIGAGLVTFGALGMILRRARTSSRKVKERLV